MDRFGNDIHGWFVINNNLSANLQEEAVESRGLARLGQGIRKNLIEKVFI